MVKKKGVLLLCLCFSMVMLAGCAGGTELTEEEQDKIAEYSAGILLQHYDKYSRRLVRQETVPQETAAPGAETPVSGNEPVQPQAGQTGGGTAGDGTSSSGNTAANTGDGTSGSGNTAANTGGETPDEGEGQENINEVPLGDLYHVKGMNVSYESYAVCKEYPKKSSAFKLTAKDGQRLFVVRFRLKNKASKDLKVNLRSRKIGYSLDVDGAVYKPTIVMQKNGGMNYLNTKLKAGGSETAILVFEIPEASQNPGAAVLTVKENENASVVQLK